MSNVRSTQIIEQKAKKNVWHIIENHQANTLENKTNLFFTPCLGYNEPMPDLKKWIGEVKEHQKTNPGLSFTIIVYPNPNNQVKVDEWLAENKEIIQSINNHFYIISDWRKKNADIVAKATTAFYAFYEKNEQIKRRIDDMLDLDVQRFVNNYSISKEEAIKYVIKEVIDCIGFMEPKSVGDEKKISALNILYYERKLYDSIGFAIGSGASELGYKPQSLIHAQSITTLVKQNNYKIKTNARQYQSVDDYFEFINCFGVNLAPTVPPEYLAKFMKAAFLEWKPNCYGKFFQPSAPRRQDPTYESDPTPPICLGNG